MKGTIDANIPDAENKILQDIKESAEHATIVDLIRNDLSINCSDIEVENYRYIDRIRTNKGDILQVSSCISGKIKNDTELGTLILGLLPAGSVSGAPKAKTLEIIKDSEVENRGYYTGIAGIYDGKNIDSCVLINQMHTGALLLPHNVSFDTFQYNDFCLLDLKDISHLDRKSTRLNSSHLQ